jgi:hypothetical protein
MLPASGMAVVAVSLRTGEPISEAVLTDEQGRYKLHIPKTETGNVRVVAAVPGKTQDDPVLTNTKLQSELLTPAQSTGELTIDDDRSLVSRYFRQAFTGRLDDLLANDSGAPSNTGNPLVDALWTELQAAAQSIHSHSMPEATRKALSARMAECLISYVDLQNAKSDKNWPNWLDPKDELVFDAYTDIMRQARLAAQTKLAKPDYFDTLPFVIEKGYVGKIQRPIDYCQFVINEYLSKAVDEPKLVPVYASVGLDSQVAFRVRAAENGLRSAIGITLITNPAAKKALIDLIKSGGK